MKRSRNRRTGRNRSKKLMRGGVCPTCVASVGFGVGKYMIGAAGVASVAGASAVSKSNRSKRRKKGGYNKKNSFQKKKKKGGSRKRKRNTRRTKKR